MASLYEDFFDCQSTYLYQRCYAIRNNGAKAQAVIKIFKENGLYCFGNHKDKTMNTSWLFPENRARRWEGINDGAAEHFLKNPIGSLAREIIQNSLDARLEDGLPVIVNFDLLDIKANEFPNLSDLKEKLKKSIDTPKNQDNRTQRHLSDAYLLSQKDKLKILKISEHNTTGMAGPADNYDSPFYAYTRGSGLTGKTDGLGSFGIGKKAPVVNSGMRTIFVSTKFIDTKYGPSNLCQGMSFWVTHQADEMLFDGTGFWGVRDGNPVTEDSDLPNWLKRKELGTTIFISEPVLQENWQEILAGAVVTNFFAAIHDEKLCVKAGKYEINHKTINNIFATEDIEKAIFTLDDEQYHESFKNSANFYQAYSDPTAILEVVDGPSELGKFILKIIIKENLPKQIGFIRNGMFIVSNDLPSLRKFQNTKDFIAVCHCMEPKGNFILREMEPPQHNAFEPNRFNRISGPGLLKSLGKKLREALLLHIQPDEGDDSSVGFLSDLLGIENNGNLSNDGPTDLNPDGSVIHRFKTISLNVIKPKSPTKKNSGNDGSTNPAGEVQTESGDGTVVSKSTRPGTRDDGDTQGGDGDLSLGIEKLVLNPRIVSDESGVFQAFFAVDLKGDALVKFYISGAESDEPVEVEWTNLGERFKGGVRLTRIKGPTERVALKVRLLNVTNEALIISAYEI